MSATHPNAIKLRDAIDKVNRGSLDVGDAFAPDVVWRIVGNHPLAGDYHGLDAWRDLMRRRAELTGGTYRPQPQTWLGSDRHVFCFLRLTAQRDDGRSIDTSHVAVFRMGEDGLAHEFWDVSSDQEVEDAFWAYGRVAERMIQANGVELCTEAFGDPADPPILLVMGMGGSMLWWEEGFCRMLADGGRFVIRYDHRDTGRSVTYEPGQPGYTATDMIRDAVGVLDAYGIGTAHVVGVSMGGALSQLLALDFPDRVASLVLISTSRALPGGPPLPSSTDEFGRFFATVEVDWSDPESVIAYLVDYSRVLAGERPFDEAAARDLARRDVERARDFAAARNHELLADDEPPRGPLSSIAARTLVIHGTADPMFPPAHGEALAAEIADATLLVLEGAGHGLDRADWDAVARAILEHTGADYSDE